MNRNQFEARVQDFCKCWLVDHIDDYHVNCTEWDDPPDIQACISLEVRWGSGTRRYVITLIPHPDTDGDIAIDTGDCTYLEAEGVDFYLWLWTETMRKQDEWGSAD